MPTNVIITLIVCGVLLVLVLIGGIIYSRYQKKKKAAADAEKKKDPNYRERTFYIASGTSDDNKSWEVFVGKKAVRKSRPNEPSYSSCDALFRCVSNIVVDETKNSYALKLETDDKSLAEQLFLSSIRFPFSITLKKTTLFGKEYKEAVDGIKMHLLPAIEAYRASEEHQRFLQSVERVNASAFMQQFRAEYGCDLQQFRKRLVPVCGGDKPESIDYRSLVFALDEETKKVFIPQTIGYVLDDKEKGVLIPSEKRAAAKLLIFSPEQLGEEYEKLIGKVSVADFKALLLDESVIVSVKFIKHSKTYTRSPLIQKKISPLKMALQAELIHPMYAIGSALEAQQANAPVTETIDKSFYEIVLDSEDLPVILVDDFDLENCEMLQRIEHQLRVNEAKAKKGAAAPASSSKEEKIKELNSLLEKGLISKEEYDQAKADILKS